MNNSLIEEDMLRAFLRVIWDFLSLHRRLLSVLLNVCIDIFLQYFLGFIAIN